MADNHSSNPVGRPTVVTPEILERLRQAFAIGCTDEEACAYAKIGKSSFYRHIEEHPEFREEANELKKAPILKAKNTVVQSLSDPKNAQWYLERKAKDEFSVRTEQTGKDGGPIETEQSVNMSVDDRITELLGKLKELQK